MAKLYFRYGAMSSSKTMNLLAIAHSYEMQSKKVLVMKPKLDVRFGSACVQSRAGLEREADLLLTSDTKLSADMLAGVSCILVDEAQFLAPHVIEQLRDVSAQQGVPVMCFGLRTDFRSRLFPGSQRLMELADSIEEVKTTCAFCSRKATMNLRSVDGKGTMDGPTICLGAEELYMPTCYSHFCEKIAEGTGKPVDFSEPEIVKAEGKMLESGTPDRRLVLAEPEDERSPER
ncbi:unnamed protein product [Effrenium voratum]|uniref:Thymidine kinase n=1 Tax=Effrenium voratum TaxID=2562239 RepID=A0AA36I926_9DINO|nr:unnamed protein product [Effrenium voratum]CAJ1416998.1 unnamed protein product [Effrenium voratum]